MRSLILLILGLASAAVVVVAVPRLDPAVLRTISLTSTAEILISFKNASVSSVRSRAALRTAGLSRGQRATEIYYALKAHADGTQAGVLGMLKKHRSGSELDVRSFWITNQIGVKGADLALVSDLLAMEEVSEINEAPEVHLLKPTPNRALPPATPQAGEQWGVVALDAPSVWAKGYRGEGVVVGSIDSGAYLQHEALFRAYRSTNGWYDPVDGSPVPDDGIGHGTHTIGTILGRTHGIGVAPAAQWISCKIFGVKGGSGGFIDAISCGQFMACPTENDGETNPRCDLAPHAVSNSWGTIAGGNRDYDEVLKTWVALGIAPIFSSGNSGTSCTTLGSPSDSPFAIAVGATDEQHKLTSFSSVGPTVWGTIKPEVAAPGLNIVSAYIGSPNTYASDNGTSMASPHVVGLAALLYSRDPTLTVDELRRALAAGSLPTIAIGLTCGGIDDSVYPNNHVGYGRVNATTSLQELGNMQY